MTPRQIEVSSLVIEGKTNKEIAAVLGIAPNTVDSHLRTLFNLFEVNNRVKFAIMLDRASRGSK